MTLLYKMIEIPDMGIEIKHYHNMKPKNSTNYILSTSANQFELELLNLALPLPFLINFSSASLPTSLPQGLTHPSTSLSNLLLRGFIFTDAITCTFPFCSFIYVCRSSIPSN